MPDKTPPATQEQINELRQRFLQKYEKEPPAAPFHSEDIERIKSNDIWLSCHLEGSKNNVDEAQQILWENCIWRLEMNMNELSGNNLNAEYLNDGQIYLRNKDINGKRLLIIHMEKHSKNRTKDDLIRIVAYWIERNQRETNYDKLTIIFDMINTGLSNLDVEFIQRISDMIKIRFPGSLENILVFELPWILNAGFKIVKSFLPAEAIEILNVINKKEIVKFIDQDNCLKSWGGNDEYQFKYVPYKA